MQYLLTEEEYNKLKNDGVKRHEKQNKELATFCQKVANNMPIPGWHATHNDDAVMINGKKAAPWGCIYTQEDSDGNLNIDWYCDDCPAQKLCPLSKNWSK